MLVPAKVHEEVFWRNYFYRVHCLRAVLLHAPHKQRQLAAGDMGAAMAAWRSELRAFLDDLEKDVPGAVGPFDGMSSQDELDEMKEIEDFFRGL